MNWGELIAAAVTAFVAGISGGWVAVKLQTRAAIAELKAGLSQGEDGFAPRRETQAQYHDLARRVEELEALNPRRPQSGRA
jgi:hypothetical protein